MQVTHAADHITHAVMGGHKTKLTGWLAKAASLASEVIAEVASDKATAPSVTPMSLGQVPAQTQKLLSAAEEIIAHAQPASHPDFTDRNTGIGHSDTIVAVVGDKVVGDVEKLKSQVIRSVQNKSAVGLSAFMTRVAKVADKRRHSVEDLLKFLERGDLPIADDGTFIIYKVLKRGHSSAYVDCHTGKVLQMVGSYVCMDESLVDPSRSNECSSGLHVARRAYVGCFSGDVVVLAKVKPEDVIAVPNHDANKMRVCGYHILFELSEEAFALLKANKPFTDNEEAQLLLGRAIVGDHPGPIEVVRITKNYGGGLKITPILDGKVVTPLAKPKPVEALPELIKDDLSAPKIDPKAVANSVTQEKAAAESRKEKALRLYALFGKAQTKEEKAAAASALLDHKKAVKLGWNAIGLTEVIGKTLQEVVSAS